MQLTCEMGEMSMSALRNYLSNQLGKPKSQSSNRRHNRLYTSLRCALFQMTIEKVMQYIKRPRFLIPMIIRNDRFLKLKENRIEYKKEWNQPRCLEKISTNQRRRGRLEREAIDRRHRCRQGRGICSRKSKACERCARSANRTSRRPSSKGTAVEATPSLSSSLALTQRGLRLPSNRTALLNIVVFAAMRWYRCPKIKLYFTLYSFIFFPPLLRGFHRNRPVLHSPLSLDCSQRIVFLQLQRHLHLLYRF